MTLEETFPGARPAKRTRISANSRWQWDQINDHELISVPPGFHIIKRKRSDGNWYQLHRDSTGLMVAGDCNVEALKERAETLNP